MTQTPFGRDARRLWLLEEGMTFLNHGAFGATPRAVLAAQDRIRLAVERQPLRFMYAVPDALRAAATEVAAFVGAAGEDLAFVENTTAGVNAILRSLTLDTGDEILTADHAYGAVTKSIEFVCTRAGAHLRLAQVPLPVRSPDQVVEAFAAAITPSTRLIVVDHVTSGSALIFPVRQIVELADRAGIPVLVDGAHALGMLPLDLPALGATWYVANGHKWLCGPKGAAILWANPDDPRSRAQLHGTAISHNYLQPFPAEFDWIGTRDLSAWLSMPAALAFRRDLGDQAVRAHNDALAREGGALLAEALGSELTGPASMLGSIAAAEVPGLRGVTQADADVLRGLLWNEDRIEVGAPALLGRMTLRVSAQVYNAQDEYERLAAVLPRRVAQLRDVLGR